MRQITPDSLLEKVARAPAAAMPVPLALPDRYEIRGVLGEGGFGVVYDAYDRERAEPVALKTLRDEAGGALYRFKREFRALSDLRHPNLVRLHELVSVDGRLLFTMERLDGLPFDRWVRGDVEKLRRAARQLVEGLTALHAAGVLHRDLKPPNVLVEPDGRVVLVDFGLARGLKDDVSAHLAGTPLYMSPEQCADEPLGPASDAYAVGAMLFEALTGRPPFEGAALALLARKRMEDAPPVRSFAPDAPPDLASLADALLARDPARRPTLSDAATALNATPQPKPVERSAFVGREEELATLDRTYWEGRDGAVLLRVVGPSGIGKTALIEHFANRLVDAQPSAWLLRGRCHPRESVPFKAIDGVVDRLGALLSRLSDGDVNALLPRDPSPLVTLFPALRTVDALRDVRSDAAPEADRPRRGAAALRELLWRAACARPVVIVIDDLQWGDEDSATVLAELLRGPDAPPVMVLAASRDGEPGALERRIDCLLEVPPRALRLQPLSREDTEELATRLLPPTDHARSAAIAREAAGNPLLVEALARMDSEDAAPSLESLVRARWAALDATARRAAELVALAGAPVSMAVLEAAFARSHAVADALEQAALIGRAADGGLVPRHDRVAEILANALDPDTRRRRHRELAGALAATGGDPEAIGAHLALGGDAAAAGRHTLEAARRARRALAFGRAAQLFERAVELCRTGGVRLDETEVELERADALAMAGYPGDAAAAYLKAARGLAPDAARQLEARAIEHLAMGGHTARVIATVRDLLGALDVRFPRSTSEAAARLALESARRWVRARFASSRPLPTSRDRARLEALAGAYAGLLPLSPLYGLAAGAMYAAEVERLRAPEHELRARGLRALSSVVRGGHRALEPARTELLDAYAAVAEREDPTLVLHRLSVEGQLEHWGLSFDRSGRTLDRAVAYAEQHGLAWTHDGYFARAMRCSVSFVVGDLPWLRTETPALVQAVEERGHLLLWVLVALHGSFVAMCAGDAAAVEHRIDEVSRRWASRGNDMQDWWLDIARMHVALARDDPEAAYGHISRRFVEALAHRAFASRFHSLEGRCFVARAAIALAAARRARREALLAEAERAAATLRAEPCAWTRALALGLEAGIATVRDRPHEVAHRLRGVIDASEQAGMPLLGACARERLSERLSGDERERLRADARRFFAEAGVPRSDHVQRFTLPGRW